MKYFFTASLPSSGYGEAHSAEAVRYKIKQMIDAEDPRKVLSDDDIVAKLRGRRHRRRPPHRRQIPRQPENPVLDGPPAAQNGRRVHGRGVNER